MRAYLFCNYYLSSIQQGIQAAHCISEMFVSYYPYITPPGQMLQEWADKHKTMIILNGGNNADLNSLYLSMRGLSVETGYPYAVFREDEESLKSAMTCVGIVVPSRIYEFNEEYKALMQNKYHTSVEVSYLYNKYSLSAADSMLAQIISMAPLAR